MAAHDTAAKGKSMMERCVARKVAISRRASPSSPTLETPNMHTHTPIAEVARALANRAEDISVALLGEPTSKSRDEYRWGRRGSLWLNRSGADRGRWYDHEFGVGGDLLDLIVREHGVGLGDAIMIAERDYLGRAEMRPAPRWAQPSASGHG